MKRLRTTARRAVTLTELLVVLVIISLLASIAVPTYIQKIAQARVTIARTETKEIAEALQTVAIIHGFVVPIRVLDNVPTPTSNSNDADDFAKTSISSSSLIDAYQSVDAQASSSQLQFGDTDNRVDTLKNFWQGPFIEYHRVYTPPGTTNASALTGDDLARDFALDPWGRPYRLFSPRGVVGSLTLPSSPGATYPTILPDTVDDGVITSNENGRFDRWAVISTGPNGYSDFTLAFDSVLADDIEFTFNVTVENESAYSLF